VYRELDMRISCSIVMMTQNSSCRPSIYANNPLYKIKKRAVTLLLVQAQVQAQVQAVPRRHQAHPRKAAQVAQVLYPQPLS
jgi:hypothetical protein